MARRETRTVALPRRGRSDNDYGDTGSPFPSSSGWRMDYSGPYRGSGPSRWPDYARRIAGIDSEAQATGERPDPGLENAWSEEFDDPYARPEKEGEILDLMGAYELSEEEARELRERLDSWAEDHQYNDLDDAERHLAETLRLMRTGLLEAEADRQAAAKVFGRSTSVARPTVTPERKPVLGKEPWWVELQDLFVGDPTPPTVRPPKRFDDGPGAELDPEFEALVRDLMRRYGIDEELARDMAQMLPEWNERFADLPEDLRERLLLQKLRYMQLGALEREAERAALRKLGVERATVAPPTPVVKPRRRARTGGGQDRSGGGNGGGGTDGHVYAKQRGQDVTTPKVAQQVDEQDLPDAYPLTGVCPPPSASDVRRAGSKRIKDLLNAYIKAPITEGHVDAAKRELDAAIAAARNELERHYVQAAAVTVSYANAKAEFDHLATQGTSAARDRQRELAPGLRQGSLLLHDARLKVAKRLATEIRNLDNLRQRVARVGDGRTRYALRWTICKYKALIALAQRLSKRADLAIGAIADTEAVRLNRASAHDAAYSVTPWALADMAGDAFRGDDPVPIEPYYEMRIPGLGDMGITAERTLEDKIPELVRMVTGFRTHSKYLLTGNPELIRKAQKAAAIDPYFEVQRDTWRTIREGPSRSSEIAAGLGIGLQVVGVLEAVVAVGPLAAKGLLVAGKGLLGLGKGLAAAGKAALKGPGSLGELVEAAAARLRRGSAKTVMSLRDTLADVAAPADARRVRGRPLKKAKQGPLTGAQHEELEELKQGYGDWWIRKPGLEGWGEVEPGTLRVLVHPQAEGLSLLETLRHERTHQVLRQKSPLFRAVQGFNYWRRSSLAALEEFGVEWKATGSAREALNHAIKGGYATIPGIAGDIAVGYGIKKGLLE